ncbi:MAG: hypothetical protein PVG70_17515 [Desulfobacterales bacterium]
MTKLVQIEDSIQDAILTIMKYIKHVTGVEPTQEEIAESLKSYFILNEVGNQIKYQLKKADDNEDDDQIYIKKPFWTLNLLAGPANNMLARAGVFKKCILEAIEATRDHMKKTIGKEPSLDIIAKSLKSSFILSEIKNQIEWQRKEAKKIKDPKEDS